MKAFFSQLKWQFVLLHKNSVLTISLIVTLIYAAILFFLKDLEYIEQVLLALVLNDPTVIGFFFIALAISIEIKHQILPAIFVTPVSLHHYLISKVLSISVVGWLCSLILVVATDVSFSSLLDYSIGSLGICILSALLGLMIIPYAKEFLKFSMISIPVFLVNVNLPLMDYLGALSLGWIKYIFPIQGGLELIAASLGGAEAWTRIYGISSILVWTPLFYLLAYKIFLKKMIRES